MLRRTAGSSQDGGKNSAAAGAKPGPNKVPGTTNSSSSGTTSRPGVKVVSRAAAPPAPIVTGPTPQQIESRKVAQLLYRLALDLSTAADSELPDPSAASAIFDGDHDIDAAVGVAGLHFLQTCGILQTIPAQIDNLGDADAREAALLAVKQLCQSVGREAEPYVVPLMPLLLERMADKAQGVREAAHAAAEAVAAVLCPRAVELVLPGKHLMCSVCLWGGVNIGWVGGGG